jgi:hypothetical protein
LPELFPTRIRATGQGFCWNMARAFTAVGPFISGALVSEFGSASSAGLTIVWIYAVGMIAIWFGPETRGVPLADQSGFRTGRHKNRGRAGGSIGEQPPCFDRSPGQAGP